MNCAEVQNRLLEHLDRSLDAITSKHLEIHLSSCRPCRTEVDSLADCIRYVAALPIVDPPLGFAQRVMAHAREIERKPRIWQRIALPQRLHKPIQATAVVLIALLGFHLYRLESPQLPEVAQSKPGLPQVATLAERNEATPDQPSAQSTPDPVKTTPQAPRAATGTAAVPPTDAAKTASGIPPPAAAKAESEARSALGQGSPRRPPIPVQEVGTGRDSSRSARQAFGVGDLPFGAAIQSFRRSAAPVPTDRPFFSMNEPMADLEFVVRRRLSHRREPAQEQSADEQRVSSAAAAGTQGTAGPAEPFLSVTVIETRWYTVAPEHLEHFKKDLAAETHIESEWLGTNRERESGARPLAIKVIILPPAPGDR
ncbi:MAG TPA: hypothetical protein VMR20_15520 [Verrucomicrobiae bacterium]|nr:hypothetical protein [Verrucomicrobiae bacterium]